MYTVFRGSWHTLTLAHFKQARQKNVTWHTATLAHQASYQKISDLAQKSGKSQQRKYLNDLIFSVFCDF